MRGKLISAFLAELGQLDTAATSLDPDAGGPLTSGYDPDLKESVVYTSGGARTEARKEKPLIRVPCQIEDNVFEALQMMLGGNSPDSKLILCFHFRDLERMGLVDAGTGEAMIRVNDRLHAIYRRCDEVLVQTIRNPPGLYVTQAAPAGFGLGRRRNLLLVTLEDRERGTRGSAS